MPLFKCPECSNEVSDGAFTCPNCGFALKKPQRSMMGKIFKWLFIGFNILMLIWLIGGVGSATESMEGMKGAERAGAEIGTGIGVMLIISMWVMGDIILGLFVLFTRPKKG